MRAQVGWAAPVAAAAGVVCALALVTAGIMGGAGRAERVQVQVQAGHLVPDGRGSLWSAAIKQEPQRMMKTHQVDFHRMPSEHCPMDTPGCAKSHQADHHIVLASDRRPRNYVYNFFTDEGDAAKDVTKDRMVHYIHPPRQALWDRAGVDRDGEERYRNKLGDNIIDVPNNQGWQSGDIHLAMEGRDHMAFTHMYKSKPATTLLHKMPTPARAASKFMAAQHRLHQSLGMANAKATAKSADPHALFKKSIAGKVEVAAAGHVRKAPAIEKMRAQTFVVSGDSAKVLKGKAARGAHRVHRKRYFGTSSRRAVHDLDSYFDKLTARENAEHVEAMFGAHDRKRG